MKRCLIVAILGLFFTSNFAKAQDTLSISPYNFFILNDTLPGGLTDSIGFRIIHNGPSTFGGSIKLYAAVQDTSGLFYTTVDSINTGAVTIGSFGDSIYAYMTPTYTIAPTKYHLDINVIVIWPVASGIITGDSATYIEVLTDPNGIQEIDLKELIRAFPNPTKGNLTLENKNQISIEEVRIYNTQGRLIEHLSNPQFVCTEGWAKGTYLINIKLEDGKTHTIRVIKQ